MRIDVWSDVVCPWCYVGKRRFERALAAFPHRDRVQVIHRSFELDPGKPRGRTEARAEVLRRKYGWSEATVKARERQMQATAAAEGLQFEMGNARSGNTADAHQLIHLARSEGKADAMVERLYRAHFSEGRSIFDHDHLVALAAEAGLDADRARQVLQDGSYAGAVAQDEAEAHALGASGVPFFVIDNRYGISGAQPTALFAEALERAWTEAERLTPGAAPGRAAASGS